VTDRHTLIAYLATLAAIVLLFALACFCLYAGKSVEAVGIGGVMTGLIGVLGSFRPQPRKVEVDQPATKPIPVEPQGDAP
jgi:hypothetical protein